MSNRLPQLFSGARSAPSPGDLGVFSIEAWPAAGGGLLVGIAEPEFAGMAPIRNPVKTAFLRIGRDGSMLLLLPYVSLEPEALECARSLVASELGVSDRCFQVQDGPRDQAVEVADIGPSAERGLRCCAATARALLAAAVAKTWRAPVERCAIADRLISAHVDAGSLKELAADAALCRMPRQLELRCGRFVDLDLASVRAEADTKVCSIPSCK
jgi:isoquinoline 1-oxidoreductase subunit beta